MTWQEEWAKITAAAFRYGLSAHFIAAIRKQENGREGREFGVLSVPAPTYDDQLRICCATVKHRLLHYALAHNPVLIGYMTPNGDSVVIYSPAFIDWFATIWAPVGADNDPHGLNRAWSNGVKWWMTHLLDAEHQVGSDRVE